jgi:hypothetical protein
MKIFNIELEEKLNHLTVQFDDEFDVDGPESRNGLVTLAVTYRPSVYFWAGAEQALPFATD